MKRYLIAIEGNNFLMKSEGIAEKIGFHTSHCVKANDEKQAEELAIALVRRENFLQQNVLNDKSDPPLLYVTNVTELTDEEKDNPFSGAISFFSEREREKKEAMLEKAKEDA